MLGFAVAVALAASPTRVEVGPVVYEVHVSTPAQVFYLVDQISGWTPYSHKQYARWAQKSLPPDESEERLLARHKELRRRHGWGPLDQAFLTDAPLEEASAAAVKAGLLSADEARDELGILQHFAPRLQPLIEAEAPRLAAFRDAAARELPHKSDFVGKLARFVGLPGTLTVPVFLMPDPSADTAGGGFNGGRLTLEISSGADPMFTLLHESFHALLDTRSKEMQQTAAQTPGLDLTTLGEGLAYALMPGILHDGPSTRDPLAEEVVEDRRAEKPWSDPYARFRAYGLYLRDPLGKAISEGSSLSTFLPLAAARFRELGPLPAQRGLSLTPLELEWLGNAGWRITGARTTVLVDPYLSRRPSTGKKPANDAEWERMVAESPPPYGEELLLPDEAAIAAHVKKADVILVTHAHPDHLLDVPLIAKKTGALVVGSESVANVLRAAGVSPTRIVTVQGGEDLPLDGASVIAVPSLHTRLAASYRDSRTIPRGIKYPLKAREYVEGGTLAYLLRIDGHRIYVSGSMNYLESALDGLRPDVAIVGAHAAREKVYAYTTRLLKGLSFPPVVFPNHLDDETAPVEAAALNPKLKQTFLEFAAEVRSISPEAQVIAPKYFETIHLGAERQP